MCRGTQCYGHILGKSVPYGDDDEEWHSIDACINSWFYTTCDPKSYKLYPMMIVRTAKDLWDKLDEFFRNNKISLNVTATRSVSQHQKGFKLHH